MSQHFSLICSNELQSVSRDTLTTDGVCEMCAANSFKNVSGNKNCTTCPSNYITQSTGATDENACGKTFLNIFMNIFK